MIVLNEVYINYSNKGHDLLFWDPLLEIVPWEWRENILTLLFKNKKSFTYFKFRSPIFPAINLSFRKRCTIKIKYKFYYQVNCKILIGKGDC